MVKLDKTEYNNTYGVGGRRQYSVENDGGQQSYNDEYVPCNRSAYVVVPTASGTDTSDFQNSHPETIQSQSTSRKNAVVPCTSVVSSSFVSPCCVAKNGCARQRDIDTNASAQKYTNDVTSVELSSSVGEEGKANKANGSGSAGPYDNDIHGATAKSTSTIPLPVYFDASTTAGCWVEDGYFPTFNEDCRQSPLSVLDLGVNLRTLCENDKEIVASTPFEERRLSAHQHNVRLAFPPTCEVDHDYCFRLNCVPSWQDGKESMVKEYCTERVGLIQDFAKNKYLGTCWRIGKDNVATCYHCVKKYISKDNYKTIISGDIRLIFDDTASHGVSYYKINQELTCDNIENDIAVLKMSGDREFPPAFDNFDFSSDDQRELPIYNIGYQFDNHDNRPVLVIDKAVVLKLPCEKEFIQLNEYMATTCNDNVGYAGLRREGNIVLWSSIIGGGSGGVCVYPDDERNNCKVYGMYQNGYPKHYYRSSFAEKERIRPCLKIESAISMAKFCEVFHWPRI